MRGIFVLGDVRNHQIHANQKITEDLSPNSSEFGTSEQMLSGYIAGGAYMVTDLVQMALFDLPQLEYAPEGKTAQTSSTNEGENAKECSPAVNTTQMSQVEQEKPILLGYQEPQSTRMVPGFSWWDYIWLFEAREHPRLGNARTVLYDPKKPEDTDDPKPPPPDFITTGRFCNRPISSENQSQTETPDEQLKKIDLLVIDDLNKSFRDKSSDIKNPDSTSDWATASHAELVHHILEKFEKECEGNNDHQRSAPLLQPMVVVILKSIPTRPEEEKSRQEKGKQSYWQRLLESEELRKRTIVILDADYLRRDGDYISESRSWELTARDFIEVLQTKERFSDLRRFGHIVVRFGVTGVLYARRDQLEWSYQLFFSPEHDDREYTTAKDGVIIGYGAVLAAAIVRTLWHRCNQDSEKKPIVNSLSEVMQDGLLHGLRACNYLCTVGYGQNPGADAPFSRTEKLKKFKVQKGNWIAGFPRDLFLRTMPFDEQLRWRAIDEPSFFRFRNKDSDSKIVMTQVLAPPTAFRSFLSHSCRNQVAKTALDIAQFGAEKIINLPSWSPRRIKNALNSCFIAERFYRAWKEFLPIPVDGTCTYEQVVAEGGKPCRDALLNLIANEAVKLQPLASRPIRDNSLVKKRCRDFLLKNGIGAWINYFIPNTDGQNLSKNNKIPSWRGISAEAELELEKLLEPLVKHLTQEFAERFLPIHAPIAKYGSPKKGGGLEEPYLTVVDRREVEGYRTLANLIQAHLEQIGRSRQNTRVKVERPLSLALFGPPGSGKSFAIKQIVAAVKPDIETCTININLGEFNNPQQLGSPQEIIYQ